MAVEKYSSLIFYIANNSCPPDANIYINRFVVATQIKLGLTLNRKINEMKLLVGTETISEDEKIPIVTEVCSQLLNASLAQILIMTKMFPFSTIPLLSRITFSHYQAPDHFFSTSSFRSLASPRVALAEFFLPTFTLTRNWMLCGEDGVMKMFYGFDRLNVT